ncbi:MAG: DUF5011 domain-containing protein [Bacteroidales bacterium]|nr:DUF5011 domain-containing protein [Bacteroidales bacterium]
MKILNIVISLGIVLILFSCNESDDVGPIITMNGNDTVQHVLNEIYFDEGAIAVDETDGNVSNNIYVDNLVDENLLGEYTVTYNVIDKAGNEAKPAVRTVFVYNQGDIYIGDYLLIETQTFPDPETCQYEVVTWVDSTLNYRITFNTFACDEGFEVFADVYDSVLIMPFQLLEDSLISMSVQGSGAITDSTISIGYTLKSNDTTSLWEAEFVRLK